MLRVADSSVARYTYLLAHIKHGASGAFGESTRRNIFTKWLDQALDVHPMFPWQLAFQGQHCLFGGGSCPIAPAVCHSMHMIIHADNGFATGYSQRQIRTLRSNASK